MSVAALPAAGAVAVKKGKLAGGAAGVLVLILALPLLFASRPPPAGPAGAGGGAMPGGNPLPPSRYMDMYRSAAQRFSVDEALLLAVGAQESGFNPAARSPAGAVGIMQMLPRTFQSWAAKIGLPPDADPMDPATEIPVASAMLAADGGSRGDFDAALLSYNSAPGYGADVKRRLPDYSAWLAGPRPTGRAPAAGWPWGQCTYWVAGQRGGLGAPVTWNGDAWEWLGNAAAQGVATTSLPAPGEIVVYGRGGGYDPDYGHVAFVEAVTDSSYTVSEMHYRGLGVEDERTIAWPDSHVAGFIP